MKNFQGKSNFLLIGLTSMLRVSLEGRRHTPIPPRTFSASNLNAPTVDTLLAQLANHAATVLPTLQQLMTCVSQIQPSVHAPAFKTATSNFNWKMEDESLVDLFIEYMALSISAHSSLVTSIVPALIDSFQLSKPEDETNYTPQQLSDHQLVVSRIHKSLQVILSTAPSSSETIHKYISLSYPHIKLHGPQEHEAFLVAVLGITQYHPALTEHILLIIVDRLLQLDVLIKVSV